MATLLDRLNISIAAESFIAEVYYSTSFMVQMHVSGASSWIRSPGDAAISSMNSGKPLSLSFLICKKQKLDSTTTMAPFCCNIPYVCT